MTIPDTITDQSGKVWQRVPSVFPAPKGVLSETYVSGKRKATLFRGREWQRAMLISASGKPIPAEGVAELSA